MDLEQFPTSERAKRMLSYVSDGFYDKSYVGKWLYQIMGQEYDTAFEAAESLALQFFPETATWGLKFHEMKWGLPVKESVSNEERRKLILQKRDTKKPATPYHMEKQLSVISDCTVHIYDTNDTDGDRHIPNHPNEFIVIIETNGREIDTEYFKQTIKKIKPTHTTYRLKGILKRELLSDKYYAGVVVKHTLRRCI